MAAPPPTPPPLPTFADVVPVQRVSSHEYTVSLTEDWCIGIVPNGGYVTSAFLVVARTHMSVTHRTRAEPHPIHLHLEFLRRTSVGPARFVVKDIKLGARISNLHITLLQKTHAAEDRGDVEVEAEGYITMTNIEKETGLTLETDYAASPPILPADWGQLARKGADANYILRANDIFGRFRKASHHIEIFVLRPEQKPLDRPRALIDQWVRFVPTARSLARPSGAGAAPAAGPVGEEKRYGRWTNDALGYLVDMFPQIVESYLYPILEEAAVGRHSQASVEEYLRTTKRLQYWYPTLALTLDIKRRLPAAGVEWLFVRVRAKSIQNGRFDLDIEVWDDQKTLIATSCHASLIVDARRNLATKGTKKTKL